MTAFTISCSQGRIAEHHDKRDYYPKNADERLKDNNKIFVTTENYETAFRDLFQLSVDDYNAKQKRADRLKHDYFNEIKKGDGKEHPFYEYVLQIGNRETNGTLDRSENAMKARQALDRALDKLQARYPSFKFLFIGTHGDEPNGTYHAHICFIPVGTGYKTGMETRCSLRKALGNMGFKSNGKPYPVDQWKQDVERLVEDEMRQLGLDRCYKNEHRRRLDTDDYKREMMVADAEAYLEHAEAMFADAESELEILSSEKRKLEVKSRKLEDRGQELYDLDRRLHDREEAMEASYKAQDEILRAERENVRLMKEKLENEASERLEAMEKQKQELQQALKEQEQSANATLKALNAQISDFNRQIADLPSQEDIDALKREYEALKRDIQKGEAIKNAIINDIQGLKEEQEAADADARKAVEERNKYQREAKVAKQSYDERLKNRVRLSNTVLNNKQNGGSQLSM